MPGPDAKLTGKLRFQAERWTARNPFAFRIEALRAGKWEDVYNGDRQVRVGRAFLSDVSVSLGKTPVDRLRFTCTAPPKSGILIDDVRLEESGPMKVTGVTTSSPHVPVLIRNDGDPVLRIAVAAQGDEKPLSVTAVRVSLAGTTRLADIASVSVACSGTRDAYQDLQQFGDPMAPRADLLFGGKRELVSGENILWVSCTPKPDADLLDVVDAGCLDITLSNGDTLRPKPPSPPGPARLGIALRKGGDDGAKVYRIPGLATTPKGTLIGVYDVRHRGGSDLPADIDIGMSRSTDGGRTWEPMKVIMDMGGDAKWRYDGIGDPSVLVDRETGTIWVAAVWSHGNRGWHGSGPGMKPEATGQLMMVHSDDEGVSWSKPISITGQVKKPEWCFLLQGPGRGITMRDGTLVFPAQFQDTPDKRRVPHSTVIYSRDHGKTWHIGTGAKPDTTESAVVELGDGSLMLNMRDNRGGARSVYTTRDMGATWTEHITSRRALPEPVCMASLLRIPAAENALGKDLLLFSNPAVSRPPRRRTTIKLSLDEGRTWPEAHQLLLDAGNSAGYSCLAQIDRETIGILYEGSRAHITFQKVRLKDLLK